MNVGSTLDGNPPCLFPRRHQTYSFSQYKVYPLTVRYILSSSLPSPSLAVAAAARDKQISDLHIAVTGGRFHPAKVLIDQLGRQDDILGLRAALVSKVRGGTDY